nr:hypothetical protein [Burkholderia pseudomallei]
MHPTQPTQPMQPMRPMRPMRPIRPMRRVRGRTRAPLGENPRRRASPACWIAPIAFGGRPGGRSPPRGSRRACAGRVLLQRSAAARTAMVCWFSP